MNSYLGAMAHISPGSCTPAKCFRKIQCLTTHMHGEHVQKGKCLVIESSYFCVE